MIFAVMFEDHAERADMRTRHMPAHLDFLERNGHAIRAAGPLADCRDGGPAGGLWLVEAADAGVVRALVEADPFWPTGLRKAVRILQWTQVFANGARRI